MKSQLKFNPITNGFRLYVGLDKLIHFDQIVNGAIYGLKPTAKILKLQKGWYDPNMKLVQKEQ